MKYLFSGIFFSVKWFWSDCEQCTFILLWTGLSYKSSKLFLLIAHSLVIKRRTGHNHGGEDSKRYRKCKIARLGCHWSLLHWK